MDFTAFANRLQKMDRHLGKWARRQGLSCFRIYDADVPGFPFAIDRYEDLLHVAEYRRRSTPRGPDYAAWQARCLEVMGKTLDLPMARIFYKERRRQRGLEQYRKLDAAQHEGIVHEYGLRFWVNLSDYLDTGLFLDHRLLRRRVRGEASGLRILNLFAYTGSFTVYAAAGRARATTTIDLSNTYLDWARRNLELNALQGPQHRLLQTDALQWLQGPVEEHPYDLIILDPPTFSNSKRMADILDVQRDHVGLIEACLDRLSPSGKLYFSTNFRKFQLDAQALQRANCREITGKTVPKDFAGSRPHRCWVISPT